MSTGFAWHERMMWHDPGLAVGAVPHNSIFQPGEHFENAETKRRLKNMLDGYDITPALDALSIAPARDEDILRVHTAAYLDRLKALDLTGGDSGTEFGDSAPIAPGGLGIARLSAGAAIAAITSVASGRVDNAYALSRPPGHHAEADRGRGFCVLANIAIGVRAAQHQGLARRVAVVDWDVHHGNGTEAIFYDDPSVLTISLHQDRLYPVDSGFVTDTGAPGAEGSNINVPLPPGSNGETYGHAMDQVVLPALRRFAPDLIVVACGFDAAILDPLGRMMLTSADYRDLTAQILDAATALCGSRVAVVHEGGYSAAYVPFCGAAVIETLLGMPPGIEDPYLPFFAQFGGLELNAPQRAAVDAATGAAGLSIAETVT
ncbi:class II histone deacetylase [Sphingopyxis sp.]|uniref:class II histone deacetylase n=1 Tax=Sphingopyxis sp. TaxID=1908224 RepID=UPI003D6D2EAB